MNIKFVATAVIAGSLTAASVMAGEGARDRVTVGQFANQIVAVVGKDSPSAEGIRATLRALGVGRDIDANAPLTAEVAAMIADVLRVKVARPTNPKGPMSAGQAMTLAGHIGSIYIGATEGSVEPPVQCLTADNRGSCNDCCKETTGLTGQYCGRFCHMIERPPSPDEPQP